MHRTKPAFLSSTTVACAIVLAGSYTGCGSDSGDNQTDGNIGQLDGSRDQPTGAGGDARPAHDGPDTGSAGPQACMPDPSEDTCLSCTREMCCTELRKCLD